MALHLLSLLHECPITTNKAIEALLRFSVWGWLLRYEHDEEQEQDAASNPGGGLEGMLVNYPTSDKGHHESPSSTRFPLISLCLHKDLLFLLMFIFKYILPYL
jgi:hypothetical protein